MNKKIRNLVAVALLSVGVGSVLPGSLTSSHGIAIAFPGSGPTVAIAFPGSGPTSNIAFPGSGPVTA
ncbi:MAG: hypothetical protein ACRDIE_09685 [Chloroflexota bacterium]